MKVNRKSFLIGLLIFGIFIVVLWFAVYSAYSKHLDNVVDEMLENQKVIEETADSSNMVRAVRVVDGDISYNIDEIPEGTDTVVSVNVVYEDGTLVTKDAYIVYSGVEEPIYEDGTYGKIILPLNESESSSEVGESLEETAESVDVVSESIEETVESLEETAESVSDETSESADGLDVVEYETFWGYQLAAPLG